MLVVGLTGGIASGKSTVSKLLTKEHHVPLIDLDVLARVVVEPSDPSRTLSKLVSHFGKDILQPDGTLDRPALGRIAFSDEAKRKELNRITHGAIRKRMAWLLFKYWVGGASVVVVDTPLLVEAGLWAWCGEMVLVYCSPEDQLSRMLSRDAAKGLTEDDARSRLASQLALSKKLPYADVVLDNSESSAQDAEDQTSPALRTQVAQLARRWERQSKGVVGRARWLLEWVVPPVGLLLGVLTLWSRRSNVARRRRDAHAEDVQRAVAERGVKGGKGN